MGRVAAVVYYSQWSGPQREGQASVDRAECPLGSSWEASAGEQPWAAAVVMLWTGIYRQKTEATGGNEHQRGGRLWQLSLLTAENLTVDSHKQCNRRAVPSAV
jgi:hypothetical protein